jgi:Zn-dependent M28 family amino/carboxypeptidase
VTRLGGDLASAQSASVFDAKALGGAQLHVHGRIQAVERNSAPNSVGILEGSDPRLKNEYIVFSAHMDHVGVAGPRGSGGCRAQGADSICNGADDDGSGTVAVVEIAEAFAGLRPRPKRSIVFLTVSGEEKGLWGSGYFAEHPPVPLSNVVADLNIDMIGRNWKDTIVAIGKEHSDLGATLNRVAAAHPELNMRPIDDIWPQENFYFRSDHFNFARKGVPILFFFSGTHADYHRPSDSPDKIDAEKESRVARLVFYLGLDIANAAERPKWNPDSYKRIVTGQ